MFSGSLSGVVEDEAGLPLGDVTVTTCFGERCESGDDDTGCVSTTTDAQGEYAIEVPQCRPKAFQCELRPVSFERDDCEAETVQAAAVGEATADVTLRCTP